MGSVLYLLQDDEGEGQRFWPGVEERLQSRTQANPQGVFGYARSSG